MELARECLRLAGDEGAIACVSAPTLYRALRKLDHNCTCKLLIDDSEEHIVSVCIHTIYDDDDVRRYFFNTAMRFVLFCTH